MPYRYKLLQVVHNHPLSEFQRQKISVSLLLFFGDFFLFSGLSVSFLEFVPKVSYLKSCKEKFLKNHDKNDPEKQLRSNTTVGEMVVNVSLCQMVKSIDFLYSNLNVRKERNFVQLHKSYDTSLPPAPFLLYLLSHPTPHPFLRENKAFRGEIKKDQCPLRLDQD